MYDAHAYFTHAHAYFTHSMFHISTWIMSILCISLMCFLFKTVTHLNSSLPFREA